ncbi:hypothetical protein M3197_17010 [Sporosarcina aquimarina]|uniref:hypothetical protein n=1 Tax=Sporosarcina aquimarina TaxID=114975 RepID=UPI00203C303C|nr:hypothetical protein [Sporosarcina aquimarina]MCM3759137.1 hypothetical protein [Sporosarcina aquimarina]
MDHQAEHRHDFHGESEVTANVVYEEGVITIELKDKQDNAPELEISHEKEIHFIIVSSDLQEYYHKHPKKQSDGIYTMKMELTDNEYKAFVDIAPTKLSYKVSPINLQVGTPAKSHSLNDLTVDKERSQTVDGHTVELNATTFLAGEEMSIQFDTKGEIPEPYLGALGHVIILDKDAEKFIHVHPVSENQTKFDTVITEVGKYKLWAEFQFNGKVSVFSFVIEVK